AVFAQTLPAVEARTVLVDLTDGSQLRLILEVDKLPFETPYGRLLIPVPEVRTIEFATRWTESEQKRIDSAIFNLGSGDFSLRETATRELLALKEKAYPFVIKATKHADLEVAQRAQDLVLQLRLVVPEEKLVVHEFDVIETAHSKLSGRLSQATLTVLTQQFGQQTLKLSDIRKLRSLLADAAEPEPVRIDADPGNLAMYTDKVGKSFAFKVTGRAAGIVWGTGIYTTDSTLAVAAVHAGALKLDETGVVRVTILPEQPAFRGSEANGISSSPWSGYPAAYQIHVPKR
ncbi:MAG TPA: LCCL domain-containing protein, partial [Pirellulaceae bacterium]|nr:LCCL domain-containing protein [Pirellulaceae bacterium]